MENEGIQIEIINKVHEKTSEFLISLIHENIQEYRHFGDLINIDLLILLTAVGATASNVEVFVNVLCNLDPEYRDYTTEFEILTEMHTLNTKNLVAFGEALKKKDFSDLKTKLTEIKNNFEVEFDYIVAVDKKKE